MPWAFLFFAESFGMNMSVGVGCSAIATNICFNETNIRKISLNQPYIRVSLFDFSFYIRY